LILDRSAFYPTSGGQANDLGKVKIEGIDEEFNVIDVIKVGKVTMHKLDREIDAELDIKGKKVQGTIDSGRRAQL
jgi:Ser-tRNA(Ala) deacylase AlaX